MNCPICGGGYYKTIFKGSCPASCSNLANTALAGFNSEKYSLTMKLCTECCHVYNDDMVPVSYNGYPMYNGGWDKHVETQALFLSNLSECESCVDIGGGDCGFLKALSKKTEGKFACIDPNGVGPFDIYRNHAVLKTLGPDTVILRHTLEHFLDPKKVLEEVVDTVEDGTVFFIEVPNVEETLERKWFCDFMPEHPQNFSRNSLSHLMAEVGIKPKVLFVENANTVLTFIGIKDVPYKPCKYDIPRIEGFDFRGLEDKIKNILDKGAILWGAAGKSAAFLNRFNFSTSVVYDSDVRKVGKYVPGTEQRILGKEDIPASCDKVFATTPWRANDIRKELWKIRRFDVYTYSNDEVGLI